MELSYSILIPIRNGSPFLSTLFNYIEKSISVEVPVIIIEDHSSDDTFRQIENFSQIFPNVKLHRNPGRGLVEALNFGFSLCSTTWVARMDIDDIYKDSRIAKQMSYVNESVAVVFSDYNIVRDNSTARILLPNALTHDEIIVSLVKNRRTPHPVSLINRNFFLQAGGYRQEAFPAEDLDLWIRISTLGSLIGVPEILFDYRRHAFSITGGKRNWVRAKRAQLVESEEFLNILKIALERTLTNLERTLSEYKKAPESDLRIFHLILDIFFAFKQKSKVSFSRLKFIFFLIRHISIYLGASRALFSYLKFRF